MSDFLFFYPLTSKLTDIVKSDVEGYFDCNVCVFDANGFCVSVRSLVGLTQQEVNNYVGTVWHEECEETKNLIAESEKNHHAYLESISWQEKQDEYFSSESQFIVE